MALPPTTCVPLLHCSWGQTQLLLGELGHCRGASATTQMGGAGAWGGTGMHTALALGSEGQDGPAVVQCVGCTCSICPGMELKSLGLGVEAILA